MAIPARAGRPTRTASCAPGAERTAAKHRNEHVASPQRRRGDTRRSESAHGHSLAGGATSRWPHGPNPPALAFVGPIRCPTRGASCLRGCGGGSTAAGAYAHGTTCRRHCGTSRRHCHRGLPAQPFGIERHGLATATFRGTGCVHRREGGCTARRNSRGERGCVRSSCDDHGHRGFVFRGSRTRGWRRGERRRGPREPRSWRWRRCVGHQCPRGYSGRRRLARDAAHGCPSAGVDAAACSCIGAHVHGHVHVRVRHPRRPVELRGGGTDPNPCLHAATDGVSRASRHGASPRPASAAAGGVHVQLAAWPAALRPTCVPHAAAAAAHRAVPAVHGAERRGVPPVPRCATATVPRRCVRAARAPTPSWAPAPPVRAPWPSARAAVRPRGAPPPPPPPAAAARLHVLAGAVRHGARVWRPHVRCTAARAAAWTAAESSATAAGWGGRWGWGGENGGSAGAQRQR